MCVCELEREREMILLHLISGFSLCHKMHYGEKICLTTSFSFNSNSHYRYYDCLNKLLPNALFFHENFLLALKKIGG